MKKLFILICFIAFKTNSWAQKPSQKITRYGLITDQDIFVKAFGMRNKDRNYTMGLAFFLSNNQWGDARLFRPFKWVSEKSRRGCALKNFKPGEYEFETGATLSLGITAFTPDYLGDKIDSLQWTIDDRPFSSLLFLSAKYHTSTRKKVETNQLVIAVLGTCIAGKVQTHVHSRGWFDTDPLSTAGWKYQVSDGGEPTFLLSNRADILLNDSSSFSRRRRKNINTQFIFMREYQLGYYTGISSGMAMRIGLLDPYNWSNYDTYLLNYASTFTKNRMPGETLPKRKLRAELYFQASIRPHYFLYNANLQGAFRDKKYDYITYPPIRHLVVEGMAGFGATVPNARKNFAVNFLFYLSGRTREIRSPLSREHYWGGFQLSFTRIKP